MGRGFGRLRRLAALLTAVAFGGAALETVRAAEPAPRVVLAVGEARQVVGAVVETFHRHLREGDYLAAYEMFSPSLRDQQMTVIEFLEVWTALQKELGGPVTWTLDDGAAPDTMARLDPQACPDPFTDYDAVTVFYRGRGLREILFEIGVTEKDGRWSIGLWRFRPPGEDWQGYEALSRKTGGHCP